MHCSANYDWPSGRPTRPRAFDCATTLRGALQPAPWRRQVALAKGQALAALEKFGDAIGVLEPLAKLIDSQPDGGEIRAAALAALAQAYAKTGKFMAAANCVAELRKVPNGAPVDQIAEQVAEAARAGGDAKTAERLFAELAERTTAPDTARRGLLGLAWRHFEAGHWDEAAASCDRLLKQLPDKSAAPEAALLRGRALEHLERADEALAMYRSVADQYGDSRWAGEALWRGAGWPMSGSKQPRRLCSMTGC